MRHTKRMRSSKNLASSWAQSMKLAVQGIRTWTPRQFLVAAVTAVVFGLILGIATVLIPNSLFARDIPPVWWNYPVWILTSIFSGMLAATYVRGADSAKNNATETSATEGGAAPTSATEGSAAQTSAAETNAARTSDSESADDKRTSRFGIAGGMLAWFAVGCPVCNKFALLALWYSGAITWFAPVQPFLAIGALFLTTGALIWRLRGQVACPVATPQRELVG